MNQIIRKIAALAAVLLFSALSSLAQPSGGPYGPIARHYSPPADAAHIYYVAPDGLVDAAGTLTAPTTLEAALAKVVTGDAVILRGGTYRTGNLVFNQRITLQPHADEKPVVKGTQVAEKWESLRDGYWRTKWTTLFPSKPRDWWERKREGMRTPLHRFNNDMVFFNGQALRSAGWEGELDDNTYYIDYEGGWVYLKRDPTGQLVEITAHDSALVRTSKEAHGKASDKQGPTIRGITFTQYAYRALEVEGKRGSVPATEEPTDDPVGIADPATFGKEVVGTVLEDCSITHCSRVGGYFRGDKLVIRRCLFSDTSTEGIYVIGSSDCLLEKNIIARNNVEQLTGYFPSSVKIFNQTRRVVFRDNLVTEQPNSNGVWYDVGNVDGVFVNNWIEGCQSGLFFEISNGVICAGNVFSDCGNGIFILNAANAWIYNNTFINSTALITRDQRSAVGDHFDWHPATGPGVDQRFGHRFVNNLLIADERTDKPLLRLFQSPVLKDKLTNPLAEQQDYNVFVRRQPAGKSPLIVWGPAQNEKNLIEVTSLADLQKQVTSVEQHSREFTDYRGPLVRSLNLRHFELLTSFPAADVGAPLPENIQKALGWSATAKPHPGAYQPAKAAE